MNEIEELKAQLASLADTVARIKGDKPKRRGGSRKGKPNKKPYVMTAAGREARRLNALARHCEEEGKHLIVDASLYERIRAAFPNTVKRRKWITDTLSPLLDELGFPRPSEESAAQS